MQVARKRSLLHLSGVAVPGLLARASALCVKPKFPNFVADCTEVTDGLRPTARIAGKIRGEPAQVLCASGKRIPQRGTGQARDRDLSRAARAHARTHERPDRLRAGAVRD